MLLPSLSVSHPLCLSLYLYRDVRYLFESRVNFWGIHYDTYGIRSHGPFAVYLRGYSVWRMTKTHELYLWNFFPSISSL
jgi:hypothetical protein